MSKAVSTGARTRARELLLQALYQHQIAGHDSDELLQQFQDQTAYERVDQEFFNEALTAIYASQAELEKTLTPLVDRPIEQLDPVPEAGPAVAVAVADLVDAGAGRAVERPTEIAHSMVGQQPE